MSEHTAARWSDRRHASMGEIVAIFTLLLQLAAIIWGAAVLTSSVKQLGNAFEELKEDVGTIQKDINSLKIDVGVMKAQGGNNGR